MESEKKHSMLINQYLEKITNNTDAFIWDVTVRVAKREYRARDDKKIIALFGVTEIVEKKTKERVKEYSLFIMGKAIPLDSVQGNSLEVSIKNTHPQKIALSSLIIVNNENKTRKKKIELTPEQIENKPQNQENKRKSLEQKQAKENKKQIKENKKRELEKAELENKLFLQNNIFQESDYKVIKIAEFNSYKNEQQCPLCGKLMKEKRCGLFDEFGILRSVSYKDCLKCQYALIKSPIYYGLPENILVKVSVDEFSRKIIENTRNYGIPSRSNTPYLENYEKGVYVFLDHELNKCPFDKSMVKSERSNVNIMTLSGMKNIDVSVKYCTKCGRRFMCFFDYVKMKRKGTLVCDIYEEQYRALSLKRDAYKVRFNKTFSKKYLQFFRSYNQLKNSISEFDYASEDRVLVKHKENKCATDESELKDIKALVKVITPNGNILELEFWAAFCTTCGKFYIHDHIYRKMLSQGIPQCRIIEVQQMISENSAFSLHDWNQESLLHMYGYNVSESAGLTEEQRHCILYNVVKNKVLTRWQIIDHLRFLVSLNKNKPSFYSAVLKWNRDIDFLDNLDLEKTDQMRPVLLDVRKKIGK